MWIVAALISTKVIYIAYLLSQISDMVKVSKTLVELKTEAYARYRGSGENRKSPEHPIPTKVKAKDESTWLASCLK